MRSLLNLKKTGLLAITATMLFASCKKESGNGNGPGTPPPAASSKLKKVSSPDASIEFAYAADGNLQTVNLNNDFLTNGNTTAFAVTYNAAKQISELRATDGTKIVAHYTNSNLSSSELYDEDGQLVFTTRFDYQGGVLQSATSGSGGMDVLKFAFEYNAAGNVSKTSTYMFNPQTMQLALVNYTTHEYDNKTNPIHAHKNLLALLFQNVSKNNSTKEVDFDDQNVVEETREYTYQYNNQNMPQSATQKTTPAGQTATTVNILYTYQ